MTPIGRDTNGNVLAMPGTESLEAYLRPLRAILAGEITELVVNRPGEVWTESSTGWERLEVPELTYPHLRQLATLIAHTTGKGINDRNPRVSAALPTGERVEALIPPACESGTVSLTIRKPSMTRFTMDDYEAMGFFSHWQLAPASIKLDDEHPHLLEHELQLVEHLRQRNLRAFLELAVTTRQTILVSGATGSGKTTFMKALVDLIPPDERLITIEDTPELSIHQQPNRVHLFYTKGGGEGDLSAGDLVSAAMRMKPDRILPAEVRDDAAYFFLEAANTGHPGSITSLHANSAVAAISRMITLARKAQEAKGMGDDTLKEMVLSTIDLTLQVSKVPGGRAITDIYYDPTRKSAFLD